MSTDLIKHVNSKTFFKKMLKIVTIVLKEENEIQIKK